MLISFEGIDGCGKTTQIKLLAEFLTKIGKKVLIIREPGGTDIAEQIRKILLSANNELHPMTELLLFEAARADLIEKVINPALSKDVIVLCDRFFDSTTAYQGYGRKLPLSDVERCNNIATRGLTPDMTFLFNISLGESKKRTLHKNPDRIENSGDGFFERVICGFIEISKHYKDRFVIVDAVRSIDEVHEIIVNNIIKKFD